MAHYLMSYLLNIIITCARMASTFPSSSSLAARSVPRAPWRLTSWIAPTILFMGCTKITHIRKVTTCSQTWLRKEEICQESPFSVYFLHALSSLEFYQARQRISSTSLTHQTCILNQIIFFDTRVNAPKLLSGYYGNSDIKKPLMVTMLRDPLERFQSAYYFFLTVDTEFLDSAGINTDQGFDHFTKRTIAQARETGKYNCILWPSLYGKHLNAWLQYTEPSQMMIVPKKLYTDGEGWLHTCQALSSRLDITLSCSPKKAEKITYSNEHPPLSEDITEDTSTQFRNFLHHNDHHKLFDALLQIHHGGGKLFGNHGDGDLPEIKSWLLQHW